MEHCRRTLLCLTLMVTLACWTLVSAQDDAVFAPPKIQDPKTIKTNYVDNRGNVSLTCSASGTPTPKYAWRYRGGNPLQDMQLPRIAQVNENTGTLLLTDFTEREEGEYQCLASNEIQPGKKITAVAPAYTVKSIVLGDWPDVKEETLVKPVGEPATLPCNSPPHSQPPAGFKWFEHRPFTSDPKSTGDEIIVDDRIYIDNKGGLHYAYLQKEDDRQYKCALFNQDKSSMILMKVAHTLSVLDGPLNEFPPEITYFTKPAIAMRNEAVELECVFSGYPPPSVSWFDLSDGPIASNEKYQLSRGNRMLTIRQVQEEDGGMYNCRGTSSRGNKRQTIDLQVVSKPIPVEVLNDMTVPEYSDVRLPCKTRPVQGGTPSTTPVWTKNGESFTVDGVKTRYSSDQTELIISNVTKPGDISCYRCVTSNQYGVFSADGCLNVIRPIRLTEVPPLHQTVKKGETVHLTIRATTDVSMQSSLKTRATFRGVVYEYNKNLPPFLTFDPASQVALINTSSLTDEEFQQVNGTYKLTVFHAYEDRSVEVHVSLEEEEIVVPPVIEPVPDVAAAGGSLWWIALICIALFIVLIVVLCVVCYYRSQRGVYPLSKVEYANHLDPERDLLNSGFHDLSRTEPDHQPIPPQEPSTLDDEFPGYEDDDDGSLDRDGDLDTAKFNEDGSFIGQYGSSSKPEKQQLIGV